MCILSPSGVAIREAGTYFMVRNLPEDVLIVEYVVMFTMAEKQLVCSV